MSRQIQIIPKSSVVTRGQPMPVTVRIHFDADTRIRGIKARFHGAERTEATYTTTSTDSKGRTTTTTHTAEEYVDIVNQDFVLHGNPDIGFFAGVGDAVATMFGGGQSETIEAGVHDFQIEIVVPVDAPASFKGGKCSVFYRMEVQVDVPIRIDPKCDYSFTLLTLPIPLEKTRPVLVQHPDPEHGRGFWDRTFGKDVNMDVALESNVLYAGESGSGMVSIRSNESIDVDQIVWSLVGTEKTEASGHTDQYGHRLPLGNIPVDRPITQEFNHEFNFSVPDQGPFTALGTKFEINWVLEVRLNVPWAKDPAVRIPVEYYDVS